MGIFENNTKLNMNVNMTGKEYIEYKKRKKLNLTKNQKLGFVYLGLSLIGVLIIVALFESITYVPPQPVEWGYSNLWGVTVHNALVVWIVVALGLGWIFHGVGFFIIRR